MCSRTIHLADTFCLEQLHPGIMFSCYIKIAEGWAALGRCEQALDILEQYTALACGNIYPLHLHGDSFFDLLDDWLKENTDLGDYLPRSQKLIRTDIARAVTENPCFFSPGTIFTLSVCRPAAEAPRGGIPMNAVSLNHLSKNVSRRERSSPAGLSGVGGGKRFSAFWGQTEPGKPLPSSC